MSETSSVVVDITMSLDGYVTAPGAGPDHGLGVGGMPLHNWVFEGQGSTPADREVLDAAFNRTGAVIMGRNTFDVVDAPGGWNDDVGYGAERDQAAAPPVFVVTHAVPEKIRLSGGRFTFVTDGIEAALTRARVAAGAKDVVVMGGGDVCHQFLAAGLADELTIHLSPMVLGDGTPLFPREPSSPVRLEKLATISTPTADHITYRVLPASVRGGRRP